MNQKLTQILVGIVWVICIVVIMLVTSDLLHSFQCKNVLISEGDSYLKITNNCDNFISGQDKVIVQQYGVEYLCTLDPRGTITKITQEIR